MKTTRSHQKKNASNVHDMLQLMRIDKPIGILLLLWPTLWTLWLAAGGFPSWKNLILFSVGCVLMRSAGCVINDYADRNFDRHVHRTQKRPLTAGRIKQSHALLLCAGLCVISFFLVLLTNTLTIKLAFVALALAAVYPFCKRYTHMPQIVLGAAFGWSIPMAWAAQTNALAPQAWLIFAVALLWTLVYDTFYAMVDREDDLKIGIRSTAILFGDADRAITGVLQVLVLMGLLLMGKRFQLHWPYFIAVAISAGLFAWQQYLIRERQPAACFRAFLHNHWVGMVIFIGIAISYALPKAA